MIDIRSEQVISFAGIRKRIAYSQLEAPYPNSGLSVRP